MKFEENWPDVSEDKSFKGVEDGVMDDDGRQVITIANSEPSVQAG